VSEILLVDEMSQLQFILFPYEFSPSVIVPEPAPVATLSGPPAHEPENVTSAVPAQPVHAVAPRFAFCPAAQAVQASSPVAALKVP
jgi:hypothetical protein